MLRYSHPAHKNRLPLTTIKQYIYSCILLILLYACQEDPSKLGLEFLQDSDMLDVELTDTVTVEAFTVEPERLITTSQLNVPLGSYVDPVFGHVKAEFLAQYAFSDYVDFGMNPVCDSLIIELFCLGKYGNGEFASEIDVYELTSDLVDSIDYYSDFDPTGLYTINKINVSLMAVTTFPYWIEQVRGEASKLNIEVNISVNEINLYQNDPWKVNVGANLSFFVKDITDIASWDREEYIETSIDIISFEDPLYIVNSLGRTSNIITNTIYEENYTYKINGTWNVTNLITHLENSYYAAN